MPQAALPASMRRSRHERPGRNHRCSSSRRPVAPPHTRAPMEWTTTAMVTRTSRLTPDVPTRRRRRDWSFGGKAQRPRPDDRRLTGIERRPERDGRSEADLRRARNLLSDAVATTPLCCPSRASTFSGRFAHNTGVIDNDGNPLDQSTTLQYHLHQRLGYQTALFGKYLNEFTGTPPFFDLVDLRIGYGDPTSRDYGTTYIADQATTFLEAFEQTMVDRGSCS